jgi:(1->4)-alpha-D-glucan 1-alpha-D-glucosylmutase
MHRPLATYRIQLNEHFTFENTAEIVQYLHDLGIDTVYASPIFKARPGSSHGYDVVDHASLNPELGGDEGFQTLCQALRTREMGLLMDVVPNHMCVATNENHWWNDVLENGPSSPYARFFDIDWAPPKSELAAKVLLPVLGDQYGRVLENQELSVSYRDGAFVLHYADREFPLAPRSTPVILDPVAAWVSTDLGADHGDVAELASILTAIGNLPPRTETDASRIRERLREKAVVQRRLHELAERSAPVREGISRSLQKLAGERGDPRSFDPMAALLAEQAYRLAHWRVAADEINYRRFFDINDLAAVRIEEPAVLDAVHKKAFELLADGCVSGLRIDHVDGLLDPVGYLRELQERACRETGGEVYVVVEKILMEGERLPSDWPVAGTTGYEFLNTVGGVFVDRSAEKKMLRAYRAMTGRNEPFENIVYDAKKTVLATSMASEIYVLARRLDRISEQHRYSQDFTLNTLHGALTEIVACFPVYRCYIDRTAATVAADDSAHILHAVAAARRRNPTVDKSVFDFVTDVLLLRDPLDLTDTQREVRREFVASFQQLTSPIMAKGWEDTMHYRFAPLACLNEVGGGPDLFGVSVERFHAFMIDRQAHWPAALSATSTHDGKRGEDVRARIAVLSEIPQQWAAAVRRWQQANRRVRRRVAGRRASEVLSSGEEHLLYQTLIGAWPAGGASAEFVPMDFVERIVAYMIKAIREAKEHSSWINVDETYENRTAAFVRGILMPASDNGFLADFAPFVHRVARLGVWGSLCQLAIKVTAPGVPDFYQGTEDWDLHLVDPDNRRAVDYRTRERWLDEMHQTPDSRPRIDEMIRMLPEARLKQHVMKRGLECRMRHREVFESGVYEPLGTEQETGRTRHVLAFARSHRDASVVTVVGRFFHDLCDGDAPPTGSVWSDVSLVLPPSIPARAYRDVVTGATISVPSDRRLHLTELFATLPLAILEPA